MISIGAQLYTVRRILTTSDETIRTLQTIKEIGYDSVQLFGSVEFAENCAKCCQEVGITIAGLLSDLDAYEKNEEKLFDLCSRYHIPDVGVSSGPPEYQDAQAYIGRINAFAAKAKNSGLRFSYHNHGHEFIKLACGETAMNLFLKGFDPETVDFMPDTYWVHDGGYDVRYFLEQTRDRVKILHLKDMQCTEQGHTFAEIGNGNLYFPGIIKTALECGIQQFVVEQDECEGDPITSLKQSYRYTKSLLG